MILLNIYMEDLKIYSQLNDNPLIAVNGPQWLVREIDWKYFSLSVSN